MRAIFLTSTRFHSLAQSFADPSITQSSVIFGIFQHHHSSDSVIPRSDLGLIIYLSKQLVWWHPCYRVCHRGTWYWHQATSTSSLFPAIQSTLSLSRLSSTRFIIIKSTSLGLVAAWSPANISELLLLFQSILDPDAPFATLGKSLFDVQTPHILHFSLFEASILCSTYFDLKSHNLILVAYRVYFSAILETLKCLRDTELADV